MSTFERYRRKPDPRVGREDQLAVRFTSEESLDDLRALAQEASFSDAGLAVVKFPTVTVLLVRWFRVNDDRPGDWEYLTVDLGSWLVYNPGYGSLYESDEANWRQFYDRVPE